MRKIELQIKLKTKDLFFYTLHHTYASLSGVFGLLISLASFVLFLMNLGRMEKSTLCVLLMVALLFPVIQPLLLYAKCNKQIKKNKDINESLHYTLTGEKIEISQGENKAEVFWYEIRKAIYRKGAVYLYMSPVRAFIFPKDECGGQFESLVRLVRESMEKYKDYEPEFEETEEKNSGYMPEEKEDTDYDSESEDVSFSGESDEESEFEEKEESGEENEGDNME